MEEERQRKRKKVENAGMEGGDKRRKKEKAPQPPPTEEEVDVFFAILRNMRVAVEYFQKGTGKGDGDGERHRLTDRVQKAVEAEPEALNGVNGYDERTNRPAVKGFLDLNSVPEAES